MITEIQVITIRYYMFKMTFNSFHYLVKAKIRRSLRLKKILMHQKYIWAEEEIDEEQTAV